MVPLRILIIQLALEHRRGYRSHRQSVLFKQASRPRDLFGRQMLHRLAPDCAQLHPVQIVANRQLQRRLQILRHLIRENGQLHHSALLLPNPPGFPLPDALPAG